MMTMPPRTMKLLECGCCGQFHPAGPLLGGGSANYKNDCRYDANRFHSAEDYTARMGLPAVEVWLDEQAQAVYNAGFPPLTDTDRALAIVDRALAGESDLERERR